MVNDDVLIKYVRGNNLTSVLWPDRVKEIKKRMEEMKEGFPGIGNNHLTLIPFSNTMIGDIIIIDLDINNISRLDVPVMFRKIDETKYLVEGIGKGYDLKDPTRQLTRWKDVKDICLTEQNKNFPVFRVDVRPTENGGPGYYYFFKSYRDLRY